uniref:Uncharacterized protein n=1 Tax=Arundo donax TaxID=35708 RepID=A0A0A8YLX7_ARUDO
MRYLNLMRWMIHQQGWPWLFMIQMGH